MKKYVKTPTPRLMAAINEVESMIKSGKKGKNVNIVLAELKLACAR